MAMYSSVPAYPANKYSKYSQFEADGTQDVISVKVDASEDICYGTNLERPGKCCTPQ